MRVFVVQNVSMTRHMALSTYLRNFVSSLSQIDYLDITVLTSEGINKNADDSDHNIISSGTDLYTLSGNLYFIFWSLYTLFRCSLQGHIDVIHCLYPSSSTLGCLLFKYLFSPKTKIVYDIRSPWIIMSTKRGKIRGSMKIFFQAGALVLERILLRIVDAVVFITDGLRRYYAQLGLEPPKIWITSPSGVDTEHFQPRESNTLRETIGVESSRKILGYAGGIAVTRELSFVVLSFRKLQEETNQSWALVFVGDGDNLLGLKRLVHDYQIPQVYFVGKVSYDLIPEMIADFDVSVCHLPQTPLFDTSFPMKVLEYLACGVPVIMSDMPAHQELDKRLNGTYLYDFDETDFTNAAIDAVQYNSVDTSQLKFYSWTEIASRISRLYSHLMVKQSH
ncbi:MAG: hypothetical protein BAJATHORv1_50107 [Candidatus Thorarchaeota archaeon]|nr:MAG: hypothetical protein BAJATHORv1_50107 [Candidatus Thorarchaeota archaeon]